MRSWGTRWTILAAHSQIEVSILRWEPSPPHTWPRHPLGTSGLAPKLAGGMSSKSGLGVMICHNQPMIIPQTLAIGYRSTSSVGVSDRRISAAWCAVGGVAEGFARGRRCGEDRGWLGGVASGVARRVSLVGWPTSIILIIMHLLRDSVDLRVISHRSWRPHSGDGL